MKDELDAKQESVMKEETEIDTGSELVENANDRIHFEEAKLEEDRIWGKDVDLFCSYHSTKILGNQLDKPGTKGIKDLLRQFDEWRTFLNGHGYEYIRQEEQEDSVNAFFIHRRKDLKLSLRLCSWMNMIHVDHTKRFDNCLKFLAMPVPEDKNEFLAAEELAFGNGLNGHLCRGCPWFRVAGAEHLRCEKGMKNPYGILGTGGRSWKVGEQVRFLPNCERVDRMKKHFGIKEK